MYKNSNKMEQNKKRVRKFGKIRIFEGFAGYGGASYGLKRLKENIPNFNYEVIGFSEFDKFAASLFDANHKDKDFLVNLFLLQVCKWVQMIHMGEVQC